MTARDQDRLLALTLEKRLGQLITPNEANTLRRASLTLHRWAELECGDGNDYASWAIERDETTDLPYMVRHPHSSNTATRTKIADREKGALRRVAAFCQSKGLYFYHQTDPRGCALYVGAEPLNGNAYTAGVACCVD